MAIIVEEENNKGSGGLIVVASWVVALAIIGVGAYYVFFKNPALVGTALPSNFNATEDISKITLRPEEVANNPFFKALRTPFVSLSTSTPGRVNPFAPFQ